MRSFDEFLADNGERVDELFGWGSKAAPTAPTSTHLFNTAVNLVTQLGGVLGNLGMKNLASAQLAPIMGAVDQARAQYNKVPAAGAEGEGRAASFGKMFGNRARKDRIAAASPQRPPKQRFGGIDPTIPNNWMGGARQRSSPNPALNFDY